jgi:hypothetical protein
VAGSVVTESTVATFVLSETKVMTTPFMGRPNWSRACAVNCVVRPTMTLCEAG